MNQAAQTVAFISLAALTLIPALIVVTSRNVLHAGYWLLPWRLGITPEIVLIELHRPRR